MSGKKVTIAIVGITIMSVIAIYISLQIFYAQS